MVSINPRKGILLIAEPSIIGDVSFNRAVVLLADHNKEGSVGFIMNKDLEYTLNDLIPELNQKFKVYKGGPVEEDNLYFIHQVPELIPGSVEISEGIFWGGNFEVVKELIQKKLITEKEIKFFLGYSGWQSEQLEEELKAKAWILAENMDHKEIIAKNQTNFWKSKIEELGGNYLIWSNAPENPNYN